MVSRRAGRSGIEDILDDMRDVMPPESSNRADYRGCWTTYGMLRNFFNKAASSENPIMNYKEVQKMEQALRKRLFSLDAKKGVPQNMIDRLDELQAAVEEVISLGPDGVKGMEMAEAEQKARDEEQGIEKPEKEKKKPVKMVPETKVQKVREDLKAEREKNERLTAENNRLAMETRQLRAELDELKRHRKGRRG